MSDQTSLSPLDRVRNVVARTLALDVSDVTAESPFDDLGADSLDLVEIVMDVETEFSIEIPDEDAEHLQTVGQLARVVEKQVR